MLVVRFVNLGECHLQVVTACIYDPLDGRVYHVWLQRNLQSFHRGSDYMG